MLDISRQRLMINLPLLNSIDDVVSRQLCAGCGACAAAAPEQYEMADVLEHGRRPVQQRDAPHDPAAEAAALHACPGREVAVTTTSEQEAQCIPELRPGWGPVLEIWEGWATEDRMRHEASSGGAATAIALAAINAAGMHGVLHTRARSDQPLLNETTMSRTREDLLRATGSRYAPASPCDGLGKIEQANGPCLFIGKPCDVAAASRLAAMRPTLAEKLGATIAIFCAGTPTTRATMRLLERVGVDDPADVVSIRYRGHGWPGETRILVKAKDGSLEERTLPYEQSWGEILTNDKQWRCHLCADHTGECADLSVGDAWQDRVEGEPGRSLILVRTERGRTLLQRAVESGHLEVRPAFSSALPRAQRNLLRGRGAAWGRLLACRLLLLPKPSYPGMALARYWRSELTWKERAQSVVGMAKRAVKRRLHARIRVELDRDRATSPPERAAPLPFSSENRRAGKRNARRAA